MTKKIKKDRKSKPGRQGKTATGVLQKNRKGFGFVIEEDNPDDIFIPKTAIGGAMNGDTVQVRLAPFMMANRREGVIIKVLSRATTEIIGTFERGRNYGFVVPLDKKHRDDVFVEKRYFGDAQKGDKVVVEITSYPTKKNSAEGKIVQIISREGEPGGDIKSLIRQSNLEIDFDKEVNDEAWQVAKRGIEDIDLEGRVDLRQDTIVTIDGSDSKDFDDGVSCKVLDNGNFLLGVHIADVAHYVADNGAIDMEAMERGNSIYLIDQVIPMLPASLSNGICSLNPKEDRLTITCQMEIKPGGQMVKSEIFESIIHSKERLTYTDVSDIIEDKSPELKVKYSHILEDINIMNQLATALTNNRKRRGSLDFDLDEAHITLNKEGIPIEVVVAERRVANRLIEEFMLLANETVAETFFKKKTPFIYRVHDKPDHEKVELLAAFLKGLGVHLPVDKEDITPPKLKAVLDKVKDQPFESVVNTIMLRTMQKAAYSTECRGHFGLALEFYTHFTSPIRRYSDLMIHRIIKEHLKGQGLERRQEAIFMKKSEEVAKIASKTERLAIDLERKVEKLKKAQYMSYHIGETFDGIISGVTSFGFYVVLPNTVEGMVKMDQLKDDYYDYQRESYRLIGRRTNKTYTLGDKVTIKVDTVSTEESEINFTLL